MGPGESEVGPGEAKVGPEDSETWRLGDNCPVWNHGSSTPWGRCPIDRYCKHKFMIDGATGTAGHITLVRLFNLFRFLNWNLNGVGGGRVERGRIGRGMGR